MGGSVKVYVVDKVLLLRFELVKLLLLFCDEVGDILDVLPLLFISDEHDDVQLFKLTS